MVVFVASDLFGDGDRKLGEILMRSATKVVSGFSPLPRCMIFMNAGVRLTTAESNLLDDLRHMETQGVELLSCGTCLDFYGLKEQLKVGKISNMAEILGTLASATQVLRL
jgi:selenium metabolism protein YedF